MFGRIVQILALLFEPASKLGTSRSAVRKEALKGKANVAIICTPVKFHNSLDVSSSH